MALPQISPYLLPSREEIPVPRAKGWTWEVDRAALLIHDMQNYFLRPYDLAAEPMTSVIANIARLKAACKRHRIPVFYTAQTGNQDHRDRGLQADLWGPGMTGDAAHQPIIAALSPDADDFVLVKHRYSAFQRSNLETLMRARGRDQLIVSGIYAHIGCMLTAAEAFQRDIQPFFVVDAVADFSADRHRFAIDYVASTCGVPLLLTDILVQLRQTEAA